MDNSEFSRSRRSLAKSQVQLARLLGVSPKAVQSFEQGWRPVPVHIERQLLFLLSLRQAPGHTQTPCWDRKGCGPDARRTCAAWEFQAGHLCWFINGTSCEGKPRQSWHEKMTTCRDCEVFRSMVPELFEGEDRLDQLEAGDGSEGSGPGN